jgi:3-hydroxybutyryl-CoA dehydrogenase
MKYAVIKRGESRSFPNDDPFLTNAVTSEEASVLIYSGLPHIPDSRKDAILIEVGRECLGEHTGENMGEEGSNVLGFARYRNGEDPPSNLIELVRQTHTPELAIATARTLFETAGYVVALCSDQAGRIIDRLVRPKYNAALRFLDEGLATQKDMDLTCRLGLGYADGPIERVVRGGLAHHYESTKALFDVYGTSGYAPARRAVVAIARKRAIT